MFEYTAGNMAAILEVDDSMGHTFIQVSCLPDRMTVHSGNMIVFACVTSPLIIEL